MNAAISIRHPAVAGMFYPAGPTALADTVDALLEASPAGEDRPRMLLSPHAGYRYSGRAAARAFRRLQPGAATTVIVTGPSHVEAFDFTSVFDGDAYETPLGPVPVDRDLARALADADDSIRLSPRGHVFTRGPMGEHGIEVILPFLQRVLGEFSFVPVVMGAQSWRASHALGEAIARCADAERTVLVASSDLSHFHAYDEAVRLDTVFCGLFERLDASDLNRAVEEGRCEACGAGPVAASLVAIESVPGRAATILDRFNSGDVTSDRGRVVGYASAAVTAPEAP